jgi:predicted amidohydrolase
MNMNNKSEMKRRSFIKQVSLGTAGLSANPGYMIRGETAGIKADHKENIFKNDEKPLRIAVVQQDGNPGEVEINREKALDFAKQALDLKADVILFHEELLIGYHEDLHKLAENVNGITTQAFQKLLKGTDSMIIYGLTEKDKNEYYVSAPVVSEDGLVANYRKTHLWWKAEGLRHEPSYYRPGNKLVTFSLKGYLCGLMICYDGDFPEMTRSYANLGCSIVFWMNNRGSRGHNEVKDLALTNSMIMPVSCCCGKNEMGDICRGGSNITGPKGELIEEIWDKEGMITGDVYPGGVSQIRKENPWYTGMRPDLYYYK